MDRIGSDNAPNPFTPVFGASPAHLAGCDAHLKEFTNALEANGADPNLCLSITGARGTGKTALLAALGGIARSRGWLCVQTIAAPGLLHDVIDLTVNGFESLCGPESPALHVGHSTPGNTPKSPQKASQAVVYKTLSDALETLEPSGSGIFIGIDDAGLETAASDLLVRTVQRLMREHRRIALALTVRPEVADASFVRKPPEFLHRTHPWRLGAIPDYEVEDAFFYTVMDGGKRISREALRECSRAICGNASMLQLVGWHVFNTAGQKPNISVEDALVGIDLAGLDASDTIARGTYQELSAGDVRFLNAMLPDMDSSRLADVARRMGVSTSYASVYKKRLLARGAISQPARDLVAFAVPGLRTHLIDRLRASGSSLDYFRA